MSIWEGAHRDLASWLEDGLADIILTHWPRSKPPHQTLEIGGDNLILVSSEPGAAIRFNPDYIFVEAGPDFARDHAVAYADAGTARLSFGTAKLGLEHLLTHGGSAYLPQRLVAPYLGPGGPLHMLDAPQFSRPIYLVHNVTTTQGWTWFEDCITTLTQGPKATT